MIKSGRGILPLISYVTLSKFFDYMSVYLQNEDNNSTYLINIFEDYMYTRHSAQCLLNIWKCLINVEFLFFYDA